MRARETAEDARGYFHDAAIAKALNVSAATVRSWEQEKRAPHGAALRLLQGAERHPRVIRVEFPPPIASKSFRADESLEGSLTAPRVEHRLRA